jgi:hypothetical protein
MHILSGNVLQLYKIAISYNDSMSMSHDALIEVTCHTMSALWLADTLHMLSPRSSSIGQLCGN